MYVDRPFFSSDMATFSAWLSVLVKRGQGIFKPRTVVKCSWDDTFGVLLDKLDLPETTRIDKVQIATNEKFPIKYTLLPLMHRSVSAINSSVCISVETQTTCRNDFQECLTAKCFRCADGIFS